MNLLRRVAWKTDYRRVLGVGPEATPQQIKESYYRLAKLHHPDTGQHKDPARFQ